MGFLPVQEGFVSVDGELLTTHSAYAFRRLMVYLPQEIQALAHQLDEPEAPQGATDDYAVWGPVLPEAQEVKKPAALSPEDVFRLMKETLLRQSDRRIIIADDPLSHLTPELSLSLLELLRRQAEDGKTVVVTGREPLLLGLDVPVITLGGKRNQQPNRIRIMTGTMILRIILGLLLLLIPAGVLYLWDKKLLHSLGLGVARMAGQTLVVCLMVWALLRYDHVWASLLWLVLLGVYTSLIILNKVKGRLRLLLPVSVAQVVGTLLPVSYLLTVLLPGTEGFTARWLVPAGALIMSHITASQIRGLSTYLSAIETDREQYEFLVGNGKEHLGAVIPFVRRAVQAILSPSAAQLAVTGLFTMPLLLAGMLLAGAAP